MTLALPTKPSNRFEWTVFASRFAVGKQAGYSIQPVGWEYIDGDTAWTQYIEFHQDLIGRVIPKENAPGIIHGDCDGWHDNESVKSCCAIVIDSDKNLLAETEIDSLLARFQCRYLFQWRAGKFHLVLPLSEPICAHHDIVASRRSTVIDWLAKQLGRHLDRTTVTACAILHPYTRRTEPESAPVLRVGVGECLDLETLLGRLGHRDAKPRLGTPKQLNADGSLVLKALSDKGLVLDAKRRPRGGQPIACPFHPEEAGGDTSTVVYDNGFIHCFHDRCKDRMQFEYLRKLGVQAEGDLSVNLRLALEAARRNPVSLVEARRRIFEALGGCRPYERDAVVVRVTTGAGKTRHAAEFLDAYSAPQIGDDGEPVPGRSAFMAMPTNALMREVSERLRVQHRKATGVLAVLNDDGSPACQKYAVAKRLQESGGDVHRLMCAECEFKDGCPARDGARSGDGSLVLTNHTLLPALATEARGSGRVPLVIWDESPAFVEAVRVTDEDLNWFIGRFDYESERGRPLLDRLERPDLFSEKFLICWRPLIEVVRRMPGQGLGAAVAEYGQTRLCEAHLARAAGLLNVDLAPYDGAWARIRATASEANRVNVAEQMFDQMAVEVQAEVIRASGVQRFLEALVRTSPESAGLLRQPGAWLLSRVTPHGEMWRVFGGVVLDATAPVDELLALRPDARVIDIDVEDADGVLRVIMPWAGLGRDRLRRFDAERRAEVVADINDSLGRQLRAFEKKLGRKPKTLLVTYQSLVNDLLLDADKRYYGNIRGYDGWFQAGYDCFITVGDPYTNIETDEESYKLLKVETELDNYLASKAKAELAQAHGRARDCQPKKADGKRLHIHVGRLSPAGWGPDTVLL